LYWVLLCVFEQVLEQPPRQICPTPPLLPLFYRFDGVVILFLTCYAHFFGSEVSTISHCKLIVYFPKPIFQKTVYDLTISIFIAKTGFRDIVGDVGHTLHASSYYHIILPYHDRLSSEHDGFHTRSAYFIDNSAWYFVTNACTNSRLTGGCLAQVCRYHIPHHYLIYFLGIYSRTF